MTTRRVARRCTALAATLAALLGCSTLRSALVSSGGGETEFEPPRRLRAKDVALPAGYTIELVASGFTFPTGVAFDDAGAAYVLEAGYSYGEVWTTPRLLRVRDDARHEIVASGGKNGPWTGVAYRRNTFYVAEGGELEGGRILEIAGNGRMRALIDRLPTRGDHHTNGPAIGPDGSIYFATGTYTNSGVVGPDDAELGWLKRFPTEHDVPCRDVRLADRSFESDDPLHDRGTVTTGAFAPFGQVTQPGAIVRGQVPCSGAILRIPATGGKPELVAWGFRNPFGLAFSPDGALYATDNGYDDRGSRPVHGAGDLLWRVDSGHWYGWPDYHGHRRLDDGDHYTPSGKPVPAPVLADPPERPPQPVAVLAVHSSSDGFDVSRSARFGYAGRAFIAQFGDQVPTTGWVHAPVGFKVVMVDLRSGEIDDFAVNRGKMNGPASWLGGGGLERPIAARFDPSGDSLYVVDFGVLTMSSAGARPQPGTGALWRIHRSGS